MRPVLEELTAEFSRRYPTVYFDLHGGGSRLGEAEAQAGRFNLGASVLPPPEASTTPEATPSRSLRSPGPIDTSLVRIPVGIDALAIIVHPNNPVANLTTAQVVQIFNGRILSWQELGGPDEEVILVSREDGSGARALFEERLMGREPVALTAVVMPTSRDVVHYVAKTPNAIGYVSRAYVTSALHTAADAEQPPTDSPETPLVSPQASPHVSVLMLDGLLPVDAAIQNQLYPLSYPIYLVSRREPAGTVRQFVDFVLSPAGQAIVGRYHVRVR